MKTKLIQTKDYLLLIDEEAEIKKNGYAYQINYERTNIQVIKIESDSQERIANDKNGTFTKYKIIAYYPLTKEAKKLDLPLLPNPFKEGIDIEKLAKEHGNLYVNQREKELGYLSFCEGYKAAQPKQFSLEDIEKVIHIMAKNYTKPISKRIGKTEIIQSLSTQQLPKEFIPEYVSDFKSCFCTRNVCSGNNCPKILKTTTNSEGKQELVGTWKF